MCISFQSTAFKDIGLQLMYTKPHIYDSNLPNGWETEYKEIDDIIKGIKRLKYILMYLIFYFTPPPVLYVFNILFYPRLICI